MHGKKSRFASDFLREVELSIIARRKALKYKSADLKITSSVDNLADGDCERFDLDITLYKVRNSIRLSLWDDRCAFFNARQLLLNKSPFDCTVKGRVALPDVHKILPSIEQTMVLYRLPDEGHEFCVKVKSIWLKIIRTGPQRL